MIIGTCSVADARTYDGTHVVSGGLVETQIATRREIGRLLNPGSHETHRSLCFVTVYRQLEAAADERGITTGAMFI